MNYFYVAYQTSLGMSWRIVETTLDLDETSGLRTWIREEEARRGAGIVPVFWKRLKCG